MIEDNKVNSSDLIIIMTTSPIRSNPTTEVIDMAIDSIFKEPSLDLISIYIICDGVKVTEQHGSQYKSGIVSQKSLKDYQEFKRNLTSKYADYKRIIIEQRKQRYCFAQNIRYIMSKIQQEFVLIFQHDHIFTRNIDMTKLVNTMKNNPINYIGFMNRSVNKLHHQLDQNMNLRGYFTQKVGYIAEVVKHDHDKFIQKVLEHYQKLYGLPLMPLCFWYDKIHIARKSYYLNVIFNKKGFYDQSKKRVVKTVSFVEDSFGTCMMKAIRRKPQLFEQLSAFILWDSMEGAIFHVHGRCFLTAQSKEQLYPRHQQVKGELEDNPKLQQSQQQDYNIQQLQSFCQL